MKRFAWSTCALLIAACSTRTPPASTSTSTTSSKRVTLLHIADTHAQLESHPEYLPERAPDLPMMGGYARLKTVLAREAAQALGPVFVADGGDTFQGSGPAAWSEGEAVLQPFNALGIDVCVPGNWEVVYGPERFRSLMNRVRCDVLAYNFHDTATGKRLFAPSKTYERGGVRVSFVGITDPTTTTRQPPEEVVGLDSTRMEGLRGLVQELRAREQPDLVVAVTHTGLTVSRQLAREIPEFDVILSGHTHERTEAPAVEGKVIIVEPGSLGSFVGRLELEVADHHVLSHRFSLLPVFAADTLEDPDVKKLVDTSLAPYRARTREVVAHSDTPILRYDVFETPTDNLITDAVRELSATDIGFSNGFRYGPPIPAGPITEGDLWTMLPLDARMKRGSITGRELRDYIERELELVFSADPWKLSGGWGVRASGLKLVFDAKAKPGQRVVSLEVGGSAVQPERLYTIGGCERAGEPLDVICRFRGAHDPEVLPLTIHQALRRYLAEHPHIAPKREGRAVARDLPPSALSQDALLSPGTPVL